LSSQTITIWQEEIFVLRKKIKWRTAILSSKEEEISEYACSQRLELIHHIQKCITNIPSSSKSLAGFLLTNKHRITIDQATFINTSSPFQGNIQLMVIIQINLTVTADHEAFVSLPNMEIISML